MKKIDFIIFMKPYFGYEHFKSFFSKWGQWLTEISLSVVNKAGQEVANHSSTLTSVEGEDHRR